MEMVVSHNPTTDFADGLTEEIISALSGVPHLRVVARTSAFAFKGRKADVREIAKQLGVEAVLEGSVPLGHRQRADLPASLRRGRGASEEGERLVFKQSGDRVAQAGGAVPEGERDCGTCCCRRDEEERADLMNLSFFVAFQGIAAAGEGRRDEATRFLDRVEEL